MSALGQKPPARRPLRDDCLWPIVATNNRALLVQFMILKQSTIIGAAIGFYEIIMPPGRALMVRANWCLVCARS